MHKAIHEYVRGCKVCQQDKHLQRQPAGKLVPLRVPEASWDCVMADRITNTLKTKQGFIHSNRGRQAYQSDSLHAMQK